MYRLLQPEKDQLAVAGLRPTSAASGIQRGAVCPGTTVPGVRRTCAGVQQTGAVMRPSAVIWWTTIKYVQT